MLTQAHVSIHERMDMGKRTAKIDTSLLVPTSKAKIHFTEGVWSVVVCQTLMRREHLSSPCHHSGIVPKLLI